MQFPLKFFTGTNIIGFYKEKVARMIGYFILFMSRRIVQGKMNTGNYTLGYFHFFPLARSYPNAFHADFFSR